MLPFVLGGVLTLSVYRFIDFIVNYQPIDRVPLPIEQYPWALSLLFIGGFVYAIAGILLELFRGVLTIDVAKQARNDALDAIRSGFTSREAPRPADIVIRINEAVEVFKARVGRSGGRSLDAADATSAIEFSTANTSETPAWRTRDSSVKFVETGFAATPNEWRADAYAKNFSGEPEAKRGLFGLKSRPRD